MCLLLRLAVRAVYLLTVWTLNSHAQELMRQASWNLCPKDIQYNTACYADPDNTFSSIAGSSSSPMPDLPDGDWALVLNKDIFQKVRVTRRDGSPTRRNGSSSRMHCIIHAPRKCVLTLLVLPSLCCM